jgi:hypothetical protein
MEQETKRTDGVGQGSGLVPGVLGEVGAGAIPGVLPVQRGSESMSDTPRTDALDRKHNPWGNHYWCREQNEWKALCGELERDNGRLAALLRCHHDEPCTVIVLKQDAQIAEARLWATELANALDGLGYPDRIQMEAFRRAEQGWKGGA